PPTNSPHFRSYECRKCGEFVGVAVSDGDALNKCARQTAQGVDARVVVEGVEGALGFDCVLGGDSEGGADGAVATDDLAGAVHGDVVEGRAQQALEVGRPGHGPDDGQGVHAGDEVVAGGPAELLGGAHHVEDVGDDLGPHAQAV